MSANNFGKCLAMVLAHEGGFVNDPDDPGGATNKGVTQAVYDNWRKVQRRNPASVKDISVNEIAGIYKMLYWDRVRGDELPSGLDYAVFDFAVNSGVIRAASFLQAIVGVNTDGVIGMQTFLALNQRKVEDVIVALCGKRQGFLEKLKIFWKFGKGWTSRITEVKAVALQMARA